MHSLLLRRLQDFSQIIMHKWPESGNHLSLTIKTKHELLEYHFKRITELLVDMRHHVLTSLYIGNRLAWSLHDFNNVSISMGNQKSHSKISRSHTKSHSTFFSICQTRISFYATSRSLTPAIRIVDVPHAVGPYTNIGMCQGVMDLNCVARGRK